MIASVVADSRPHICFVSPNALSMLVNGFSIQQVGGAELQQVLIARGLARRGYAVSMICLDFGQEDRIEIDGITVHRAYRHSAGLPVLRFIWPRLTSIWRCLKEVDADIYYQRTAAMITGAVAAFCRLNGKKSIFAAAGETIIRIKRDEWIFNYGVRTVDRVLVQNAEQARIYEQEYARESILVPNLYDPSTPRRSASGQTILWVSTIRQIKRPGLLLDLAEALPQQKFTMVGGPDKRELLLFETIKARAQHLPNVEFLGFIPYSKVGSYFDDASVFVNTSETEGFPNTFLQSWARRVPTVSFVDSGARIDGKYVGLVVSSVEEMIPALKELSEDHGKRAQIGQECQRYLDEHHGPDQILDIYEGIFRELLQES